MPKRLEIASHLTISELKTKYREATNPVTRSQYQITEGVTSKFNLEQAKGLPLDFDEKNKI